MSNHLRLMLIPALLAGVSLTGYSETIGQEDARAIATEFFSHESGKAVVESTPVFVGGTVKKPLYYVFNRTGGQGFVIISADDVTAPVLGYSFTGSYATGAMPEAMGWVLEGLEKEIKAAPWLQGSKSVTERKRLARHAGERAAEKLLQTASWSQEAPFNTMIPGQPLVGCVGTAMATIMKYHEWPAAGSGNYDGVDFGTSYSWSDMRTDNYRSGYSKAEGDAVALLMYHASKSIGTQYAMSGSSAYEVKVPAALTNYFGYDPGVSYKKRSEVALQAEWDKIVKDEIDAGRPVLYCGQDVTAGHAFVCDGYQDDYLHFNWGWGGSANGYFLSTVLNPTVSRTHNYNNLNTIIYNIKPATGEVAAWSPIHITADGNQPGIGSDLTDLTNGKSFTVRVGNLKNLSYTGFSGKIAVALCASNGAMKSLLCTPATFKLESMAYLFNGYTQFPGCALPSGTSVASTDRVMLVTQADGASDWLPVAGELFTVNEIAPTSATPATFSITLPSVGGVTVDGADEVIRGWDYKFKVTPANTDEDVLTVKANGYVLTPGADNTFTIANVCNDQAVSVLVQKASEVKGKRSIWVGAPGTLAAVLPEEEAANVKELTLFGTIDARDFEYIRSAMRPTLVDLSGVTISANGSNQANAIPREAFRGIGSLQEVVLPASVNRLNNGCFRQCGITTITIPANVKTYEYNVFCGASKLRDIYVGRTSAEFINWCVLSGVPTASVTLHVPSQAAVNNYSKAENWNTIGNILVDPVAASDKAMFAVMDNAEVKFDCDITPGLLSKGSSVEFTASHIADNDNRMDVYANSMLLQPDAAGVYKTKIDGNTIIHFDMTAPIEVDRTPSLWKLNASNGSVGLVTDAVNVLKGQEFTVRVNAVEIPQYYDQFYWGMVLTDAKGNIKEFISPVNVWSAGAANNHKFNVTCCVKDSEIREGNKIALATSAMKKTWNLVKGANAEIVDALPALNNMTEVHNITVTDGKGANVSGIPATAVHGRDITINVVPQNAAHRINLTINDNTVQTNATSISYPFVVKEDLNINVEVFDPKADGVLEMTVTPGTFHVQLTADNVCPTVRIKGEVYSLDLQAATGKDFAINTIKTLDLSGVKIVASDNYEENVVNHPFFVYSNGMTTPPSVVENIILPDNVVRIAGGVFKNCANIKEISLPKDIRSVPVKPTGSNVYQFGLANSVFSGCTNLVTIYIPGEPGEKDGKSIVAHHRPDAAYNPSRYEYYNLGHEDPKKVTVIVPQEFLTVYRTPYNNADFGNPWYAHGYNILSEYPVYGVNFDQSRVDAADDFDIEKAASFLGDNVSLESLTVSGKLKLHDKSKKSRIHDNGELVTPAEDGTFDVTFYNPAKVPAKSGHRNITVEYLYDVNFDLASELFSIEKENDNAEVALLSEENVVKTHSITDVKEGSTVRFKVNFHAEHTEGLAAKVMDGTRELTADEDGYYTLENIADTKNIKVFAVPSNGVTLNEEELMALNPEESKAVTEIALSGEISSEGLTHALECFPELESLDMSEFEGELPEGVFADMENLVTVTLPNVEEIGKNMFSGCTGLKNVDIPATVNVVGEGAFRGCESLETIRLTGVTEIGANAFNGCEYMTTITLLSAASTGEAPQQSARKVRKSNGVHADAFTGLNPNCIIVLDEGVNVPASTANYLTTTTGKVTETMPDGTLAEREGRIYHSVGDIALSDSYPLSIPHGFTLPDENTISFTIKGAGSWGGLVVPFDVQKVLNKDGDELEAMTETPKSRTTDKYEVYGMNADSENPEMTNGISANTPYLFRSLNNNEVKFESGGLHIVSTPAEIKSEGKDYTVHAVMSKRKVNAAGTYVLNNDASGFIPADADEDGMTELEPYTLYAVTPNELPHIETYLPDTDFPTLVDEVELADGAMTVMKEGDKLVITVKENTREAVYTADGKLERVLQLAPGRNEITLPQGEVYIIRSMKVIM